MDDNYLKELMERFFNHVIWRPDTPVINGKHCLDSTYRSNKYGYCELSVSGEKRTGTHVAWLLEHDNWPEIENGKTCIRHRCDRPTCVEIEHLEHGKVLDNIKDMVERNRHNSPTECNNNGGKFYDAQVYMVKMFYARGEYTLREISKMLNISSGYVSEIISGTARPNVLYTGEKYARV